MTAARPAESGSVPASVLSLLARWQQAYAQGYDLPALELCPDPARADQVQQLIEQIKRLGPRLSDDVPPTWVGRGETPPPAPVDCGPGAAAPPGFQVLRVLGQGGMGVVYQARQLPLNRVVALKMILAGEHAGHEQRVRFLAEAEAVAAIKHPGVVEVYECGTHQGNPFLAMEFCEGGSLTDRLAGTPLPPAEAAAVVEQVARAVQAAHQRGIIHRDLKPANVLVGQAFQPDSSSVRLESLTYKVSDFGLAKRVEGGPGLTATGAVMGTPSYMAPEQAEGKKDVGPLADVYALGAILYECLTGRPPFRAATAYETLLQVVGEEPVPPRRLNAGVPRDVETICLMCLHKEPGRRYGSAEALADDLGRWRAGEPIQARSVGAVERAAKWVRRRPTMAALLAGSVVAAATVVALTTAALLQWQQRQADRRGDVAAALTAAADHRDAARWEKARRSLEYAEERLGEGGPADLRQALTQADADLALARRLDAIRLKKATVVEGKFLNVAAADREYAEAFGEAGLGSPGDDVEAVAARVKGSAIRTQLLAALDDWAAGTERDQKRQAWLLGVAGLADDPSTRRFRDPRGWEDTTTLRRLAEEALAADAPSALFGAMTQRLGPRRAHLPLLKAAVVRRPSDFWAQFNLANALSKASPREAVGFYWAALGLRPRYAAVHNNLGAALHASGDVNGAIASFRTAVECDSKNAPAHTNLGIALRGSGDLKGAMASFRAALLADPKDAPAHHNLGIALRDSADLQGAIARFRMATECDPKLTPAHINLGVALSASGDHKGAMASFRAAIACDPKDAQAHYNLGGALYDSKDVQGAMASFRAAIAADPKLANAHGALGQALLVSGRFAEAISSTRCCLELLPANHPLRPGVSRLLQQCEALLALDQRLPAVLQGQRKPANATEMLNLAHLCAHYKKRPAAAARFYADAFAARPAAAADLRQHHRYNAACAALAAAEGIDTDTLGPRERRFWRAQAYAWLKADLAAWQGALANATPQDRQEAAKTLAHWQNDPDFVSVREPAALAWLPLHEALAWAELWADVEALLRRAKGSQ